MSFYLTKTNVRQKVKLMSFAMDSQNRTIHEMFHNDSLEYNFGKILTISRMLIRKGRKSGQVKNTTTFRQNSGSKNRTNTSSGKPANSQAA